MISARVLPIRALLTCMHQTEKHSVKTEKHCVDLRIYNFNMQTDQPGFYRRKLKNALYIFKRNMIQSSTQANESSGLVNNVEYSMD